MHGPTFMGNPLACAVALASIELLLESDWQGQVMRIESRLREGLAVCADMAGVSDVRCLGAIGVVEMKQAVDMRSIVARFVEAGVWVRPFGRLVYLMPSYCIEDDQLGRLCAALAEVIEAETG